MKQNLAKVLGMEEHNQRTQSLPSEEQLLQQSQTDMEQYLEGHQQATEVALEAIGNAQALAGVIACNDSTDKTTYELLKVAVEQLKEKTGVVTQSTALESIDRHNYKTEALQDVKEFIKKVWEAIKKAFFAMVDRVKAFFKGLLDRSKVIEKKAEEVKEDIKEFESELNKAPKKPEDAKNYNSSYFDVNVKRPAEPGSASAKKTPEVKPKDPVNDVIVEEIQGDYSEKIKKLIGVTGDEKDNKHGFVSLLQAYTNSFSSYFSDIRSETSVRVVDYPSIVDGKVEHGTQDNKSIFDTGNLLDKEPKMRDFRLGAYSYGLGIKDKKLIYIIDYDSDKELFINFTPIRSINNNVLPIPGELLKLVKEQNDAIAASLAKRAEKFEKSIESYELQNIDQETLAIYRREFTAYLAYLQSAVTAISTLSKYTLTVADAISEYAKETLELAKKNVGKVIRVHGYVNPVTVKAVD